MGYFLLQRESVGYLKCIVCIFSYRLSTTQRSLILLFIIFWLVRLFVTIMKTILLADDHSFFRKSLTSIIRDEYPDIHISEVADGRSLVNEAGINHYDLVISDIEMPVMNGLDALIEIRSKTPGLPVLMISSYSEDTYALKAIKAGACGFLTKSSIPEKLIVLIQLIAKGGTQLLG